MGPTIRGSVPPLGVFPEFPLKKPGVHLPVSARPSETLNPGLGFRALYDGPASCVR